eukprot:TRINITY_DN7409_c1_g1_i1.p1 TRINITY_DN7409_c1_g1~~TRINITY_DN7409_c1_g1_i1.p1  ORF type:complete len:332 (+),score=116.70 TRINITY_DN7409_c1_g1_i1:91-996(+)
MGDEEGEAAAVDVNKPVIEAAGKHFDKLTELEKTVREGGDGADDALQELVTELQQLHGLCKSDKLTRVALGAFADAGGVRLAGDCLELVPLGYLSQLPGEAKAALQHEAALLLLRTLALWPRAYDFQAQWREQLEGPAEDGQPPPCATVRRVTALLAASCEGEGPFHRELTERSLVCIAQIACGGRSAAVLQELGAPGLCLEAIQKLRRGKTVAVELPARGDAAAALEEAAGVSLAGLSVQQVDPAGPAHAAGVGVGMRLQALNGAAVNGLGVSDAYAALPKDAPVTVAFEHPEKFFSLPF